MKTRLFISISGCLAALATSMLLTGCASGPSANPDITASKQSGPIPKKADLLFVQNAPGVTFNKGVMTLRDVNPITIAFADRPERFAGHMPTSKFIPMWSEGKDSFLKDPPNGTVSVFHDGHLSSLVVVLRNPRLANGNLSYDVQVLEGTPPASGGAASLFIDIIGMPLTPMSYAGVARRNVARGAYYAGGYSGATVVHYGAPAAYYGGVARYRGGAAVWGGGSGAAVGYRGTAQWGGGSGSAQGYRGGSASWGGGSGSAQGWRGNSVSWHRR
jgi:hypothetical protein